MGADAMHDIVRRVLRELGVEHLEEQDEYGPSWIGDRWQVYSTDKGGLVGGYYLAIDGTTHHDWDSRDLEDADDVRELLAEAAEQVAEESAQWEALWTEACDEWRAS